MKEWYSNKSLSSVLNQWEKRNITTVSNNNNIKEPFRLVCYNVEGWGTRALESIELVDKIEASICVLTEVGDLWNINKIPHFNTFYQKGTNHSGGVCIAVGKHLKTSRIETDIPNTVVIDILGLSEPVRIIGIYWPHSQTRNLNDILPFILNNTIITGDFNAAVKEWDSPSTDGRGASLKEWIEENNLTYIPSTAHTSKRSLRNIDLTFTNMTAISCETLHFGTSDHWPLVLTCNNIFFDTRSSFHHTNWKAFEAILVLLQPFWGKEQKINTTQEWYTQYARFLSAVKNRVTKVKQKEKYRPTLPHHIVEKLKEVRKIRNKYYHQRQRGNVCEETRILLRILSREVRNEIGMYKASQWQNFLTTIQQTHDNKDKMFWSFLSRIYKTRTLPFYKLLSANKIVSEQDEIIKELYKYYKEQFKASPIDHSDAHEMKVESEYDEVVRMLLNCNEQMEKTNTTEITRLIRSLKPKKSAGVDQISNFMIKKLPPGYIDCLVKCFNEWLSKGTYPEDWKIAKITTLNKLKAGVPECDQTRPISLLATHSKLFEKLVLHRVREWAEKNQLVPVEQSGFRPRCLLPTRVLSIYQEVKNNMAANIPTAAIYVDYQKAYDRVWHAGLVTKLWRLGIPPSMLKMIVSWLKDRKAYVMFGEKSSETFDINIGLPQGSSLSPYLFIVFHCDLIQHIGAHSSHIFADDLCVLIRPPILIKLAPMVEYLEREGTRVCNQIYEYSKKWKQPINVKKTVAQLFYTQIKKPIVNLKMNGQKIELVNQFRYLGFTWTSKLSLKPTVDRCIGNIQKSLGKLRWLRTKQCMSMKALRQCFFAYSFPHFAWIFPFFPLLPESQQQLFQQKFRVALRLVHRCPFVSARNLFTITKEQTLNFYVEKYIQKRLKHMHTTDLGRSLFYNDVFFWDEFHKRTKDHLGHFFRRNRVKQLIEKHESLLLRWISFTAVE